MLNITIRFSNLCNTNLNKLLSGRSLMKYVSSALKIRELNRIVET